MKYDYKVEMMPGFGYPAPYDRDEKNKRIWQVTMIERDDMGSYVRDIEVRRDSLTHNEATSLWSQLLEELRKAERESLEK